MLFDVLGLLERYHPRRQLRMQLARIMLLNLLNLYALIFALFDKISTMSDRLQCLKQNITDTRDRLIIASFNARGVIKHLQNTTDAASDGYDLFTTDLTTEPYLNTTFLYDTTTTFFENTTRCYQIAVSCVTPTAAFNQTLFTTMFLMNLTSTMVPEYVTNGMNTTFLNYDDFDGFNVTDPDYYLFENTTDRMYDWMNDNTTDYNTIDNVTMLEVNGTRRFKREYNYDDNRDNETREASFFNAFSDFYANLSEGTNFSTILYGNESDIYATISTILDNITTTSWTDENITDYERKCCLNYIE